MISTRWFKTIFDLDYWKPSHRMSMWAFFLFPFILKIHSADNTHPLKNEESKIAKVY